MSSSAEFPLPEATATVSAPRSKPFSDVRLFHTADGGEIELTGGQVTMADGLESAVYLSLFGGNERDSGLSSDDRLQWWGNLGETNQARVYRSQTQHLLRALPASTANLRRVEDAIDRDLNWLKAGIAREVLASATMPRLGALRIDVTLVMNDDSKHSLSIDTSWSARA